MILSKFATKLLSVIFLTIFLFSSTVVPTFASVTYLYDANGNMTSDGQKCYTYNEANQLTQVRNCNNNQLIAEYVYDYKGTRIVKKQYVSGSLQQAVYSPTKEYETKKLASNSATSNTTYYSVNDEVVARKDPDGSKIYYQNDHLNSTSMLTNQSGTIVENTTYFPYGDVRSGGTQSKFQYTGKEKDQESGLSYYESRFYNSKMQRFIQPDTMLPNVYDPQQLNRYSYVRNNPLRYTDPSGHCIWDLCIVEGIGVIELSAIAIGAYAAIYSGSHITQTKSAISAIVGPVVL